MIALQNRTHHLLIQSTFQRFVAMFSRILLLLVFLLGSRTYRSKETIPLWVEAFSTLPQATRPTRINDTGIQRFVRMNQPQTTYGFSSSLYAWRKHFVSTRKVPRVGKDGLYHITTEEEYRYVLTYIKHCCMQCIFTFRIAKRIPLAFVSFCVAIPTYTFSQIIDPC